MSESMKAGHVVVRCYPRAHLDPGPKRVKSSVPCGECGQPTAGGKAFCEDHLARMPYAASLMAAVSALEREHAVLVRCSEARPPRNPLTLALRASTPLLDREVSLALAMRTLEAGGVTVERMTRLVPHLAEPVALLVLQRLQGQGLAEPRGRTKRGSDLWRSTLKGLTVHAKALSDEPG